MINKYKPFIEEITNEKLTSNLDTLKMGDSESKENDITNSGYLLEPQKITFKNKEFLNRKDIDLLFPGQVRSYYASAEF